MHAVHAPFRQGLRITAGGVEGNSDFNSPVLLLALVRATPPDVRPTLALRITFGPPTTLMKVSNKRYSRTQSLAQPGHTQNAPHWQPLHPLPQRYSLLTHMRHQRFSLAAALSTFCFSCSALFWARSSTQVAFAAFSLASSSSISRCLFS